MKPHPDTEAQLEYIGNELELFQLANNWKRYLASRLRPFVKGEVLEVGSGLGANIPYVHSDAIARWVSLEPDVRLCDEYRRRQAEERIPACCELIQGILETLPGEETFDSILYIDVLEHIQDDRAEFERAYGRLRSGGHLVVVCPAHDFLFSPFDEAIGHFRRYDKPRYRGLCERRPLTMEYLDSVGMIASVANKLLLKQSYPNEEQIKLWDRLFVRLSRIVDPLTFRLIGKSILGVWRK